MEKLLFLNLIFHTSKLNDFLVDIYQLYFFQSLSKLFSKFQTRNHYQYRKFINIIIFISNVKVITIIFY